MTENFFGQVTCVEVDVRPVHFVGIDGVLYDGGKTKG